jgi:hypothetical protein
MEQERMTARNPEDDLFRRESGGRQMDIVSHETSDTGRI